MRRFVEEADRGQWTLLPECLDDFIDEDNPVRVIDVFVDALDLAEMSFDGVEPAATGRPSYHPSVLLKLYIYGYLNRVQSSRRLEREAGRNVEVMWLLGRLAPDHKTIADFRKDNGLEAHSGFLTSFSSGFLHDQDPTRTFRRAVFLLQRFGHGQIIRLLRTTKRRVHVRCCRRCADHCREARSTDLDG